MTGGNPRRCRQMSIHGQKSCLVRRDSRGGDRGPPTRGITRRGFVKDGRTPRSGGKGSPRSTTMTNGGGVSRRFKSNQTNGGGNRKRGGNRRLRRRRTSGEVNHRRGATRRITTRTIGTSGVNTIRGRQITVDRKNRSGAQRLCPFTRSTYLYILYFFGWVFVNIFVCIFTLRIL